jgi:aldose 1-epimerase
MIEPPSGRQVEIRHAGQRATIVEVGGGLREYVVDDQRVLDGYAADEMASGGRGQILLPWPNRLADGQYEFDGHSLQLPIDEQATRTATHGLVRWANWTVEAEAENRATARLRLHPRPGYPFNLLVEVMYVLDDDGLSVRTVAMNVGRTRLPFGIGFHPYLTVGTPRVDAARLALPARRFLETDERKLPTGRVLDVAGSDFDFREARPIGGSTIDTCFTELERGADGRAWVILAAERHVRLWLDRAFGFVQVFTGDTLVPERRRQGLAVEPMTCPANAFRSGLGLLVLEPEQSFSGAWGVRPSLDRERQRA